MTLRYRIVPAPDDSSAMYAPLAGPGWFQAEGEALFIRVAGRERARFTWRGRKGLPFASDLEHVAEQIRPFDDLAESTLLTGPQVRVRERLAAGQPVRIAVAGEAAPDEGAFVDLAVRVLAAEREFWGGREDPFLVTLAPFRRKAGETWFTGTARGDAFSMMTTPEVSAEQLAFLLAHEYFHTWNPYRLGGLPEGESQRSQYWFSEGFTDFYARRLLHRAGLISDARFAEQWNEVLRAYARSSVRTVPNARIVADFHKDDEVSALPYQRGGLLAAIWDSRLKAKSNGQVDLDAVLRAQAVRARSAQPGDAAGPLFLEAARRHGLDVAEDIERHIERGEPISLPANAFGPCFVVASRTVPVFERGWDSEATNRAGLVITGLRQDSPAYAAGLREGMKVSRLVSGTPGDATTPYVLEVLDGAGATRTIRFLPAGRATMTLQQVSVEASAPPAECSAADAAAGAGRLQTAR